MKIKEVEKLLSACEVDLEDLKNNMFLNPSNAKEDDRADINSMLVNMIRKDINSRLLEIENGEYRWLLKNITSMVWKRGLLVLGVNLWRVLWIRMPLNF